MCNIPTRVRDSAERAYEVKSVLVRVRRPLRSLPPNRWRAGLTFLLLLSTTLGFRFSPRFFSSKSALRSRDQSRLPSWWSGGITLKPFRLQSSAQHTLLVLLGFFSIPKGRSHTPLQNVFCFSFSWWQQHSCVLSPLPEAQDELLFLLEELSHVSCSSLMTFSWVPLTWAPSSIFSLGAKFLSLKLFESLLPSSKELSDQVLWISSLVSTSAFPAAYCLFHCRCFGGLVLDTLKSSWKQLGANSRSLRIKLKCVRFTFLQFVASVVYVWWQT